MADDQHRTRRGGVETSIRTAAIWRSVLSAATQRAQELGGRCASSTSAAARAASPSRSPSTVTR